MKAPEETSAEKTNWDTLGEVLSLALLDETHQVPEFAISKDLHSPELFDGEEILRLQRMVGTLKEFQPKFVLALAKDYGLTQPESLQMNMLESAVKSKLAWLLSILTLQVKKFDLEKLNTTPLLKMVEENKFVYESIPGKTVQLVQSQAKS